MNTSHNITDHVGDMERRASALDARDPVHERLHDAKMRYLGATQGTENMELALRQLALVLEEIHSRTARLELPMEVA